ncbi:MAG TPA: hypothetical protein V6D17_21940 [Candidatus Obscuribacterales bacterium]
MPKSPALLLKPVAGIAVKLFVPCLSALIVGGQMSLQAFADEAGSQVSNAPPASAPARGQSYREDVLLIMAARGADPEEIKQVIKEAKGQIVETNGEGELAYYVVKVEKGKLVEAEKKLSKDKRFSAVQRDYVFQIK